MELRNNFFGRIFYIYCTIARVRKKKNPATEKTLRVWVRQTQYSVAIMLQILVAALRIILYLELVKFTRILSNLNGEQH